MTRVSKEAWSHIRPRLLTVADRLTGVSDLLADAVPPRARPSFVVLDDIFPHPLSAFRVTEYNRYLRHFAAAEIHSSGTAIRQLDSRRSFRAVRAEYELRYPEFRGRVRKYHQLRKLTNALAYTIFLGNACRFLPFLERDRNPLVFTLYPGGGFALEDPVSDAMLRRVCSYSRLQKIIVTQRNTREYLLSKGFCTSSDIEFIYGGAFPSDRLPTTCEHRRFFGDAKPTLDICFVAHKYIPLGRDKGYDVFVRTAERLSRRFDNIAFHVVGPYDETDIDVSALRGKIRFYGSQDTSFFWNFYSEMDIILSPNAPFLRSPGMFDGFPTGACMEAGMSGVAVFCSDDLNLNVAFREGEEIAIVSRDSDAICDVIAHYYCDPAALHRLQIAGQRAFRTAFDVETQMSRRVDLLSPLASTAQAATQSC
jgi:glycosyltransferase involved in cell wall biosynthesis